MTEESNEDFFKATQEELEEICLIANHLNDLTKALISKHHTIAALGLIIGLTEMDRKVNALRTFVNLGFNSTALPTEGSN